MVTAMRRSGSLSRSECCCMTLRTTMHG